MQTQELIHNYISRILEDVNSEQLVELAALYMESYYENCSQEDLISEVQEFYPDLLDD